MTASLVPVFILPDPCEHTGLSKASPGRRGPLVRVSQQSPGSHGTSSPSKNPLRMGLRRAGREGTGRLVAGGRRRVEGDRGAMAGAPQKRKPLKKWRALNLESQRQGRSKRNESDVKIGDRSRRTSGVGFIPGRSFRRASPALRNQGPRPTEEGFGDREVSVLGHTQAPG